MSWLSSFVEHNRDFAGNALKNVSPFAFLIPGVGPLAAAGLGAAGSALGRGIQHGANLGDIARQGIQGGSEAYGGSQALGALRGALGAGASQAAAPAAGGELPSGVGGPGVGIGTGQAPDLSVGAADASSIPRPPGLTFGAAPGASSTLTAGGDATPGLSAADFPSSVPQGAFGELGASGEDSGGSALARYLKGAGSAASQYPAAIGQGLQGLGNIAGAQSNNALRRAQIAQMEYETQRQKNRDSYLANYLQQYGQLGKVAPNPWGGR